MFIKLRNINKNGLNKQLALPLTFKSLKNRENFIISKCNHAAISLIDNTIFWRGNKKINSIPAALIHGPKGSGKTHLSNIFKEYNDAIILSSLKPNDLDLIKKGRNYIIDDFTPNINYPSVLVLHFLNQVTYNEGSILFLSKYSAFEMDWELDDLNSRIRSLIACEIKLPDDMLLYTFMIKYANDKKLILNDKQCLYILERLERSFESVINFINKLDLISLETKKKVSYNSIQYTFDALAKN
jgi:chromosomal replication initiation ATPase DnaA